MSYSGMKWTEQEFAAMMLKRGEKTVAPAPRSRHAIPQAEDGMNKLEARYVRDVLDIRKMAREITGWKFDRFKLRLAKRTWYTPDFFVKFPDGHEEIHETKGHWEDDARVKIKVAAEMYREFKFVAVQYKKGIWIYEEF